MKTAYGKPVLGRTGFSAPHLAPTSREHTSTRARVLTYGIDGPADIRAENVTVDELGRAVQLVPCVIDLTNWLR